MMERTHNDGTITARTAADADIIYLIEDNIHNLVDDGKQMMTINKDMSNIEYIFNGENSGDEETFNEPKYNESNNDAEKLLWPSIASAIRSVCCLMSLNNLMNKRTSLCGEDFFPF